ncbi:MAG: peptidase domain-containing ABC transporter [Rhizomicrobium sp.]
MTGAADLLRTFSNRKLPLILQTEVTECGLACLAMIAGYHGLNVDLTALRRRFSVSLKGTSLKSLMTIADALGFSSRAVRLEISELSSFQSPVILHWHMSHFVVLKGRSGDRWVIHDPVAGVKKLSAAEMSAAFTGVALELTPAVNFQETPKIPGIKLTQLWTRMVGLGQSLTQALMLTFVLQAWVIGSPLFLQIAIDDVLPRSDMPLLSVLLVAFASFAIINAVASGVRQLLFLVVGNLLSFQIASNVAKHLLRLPISYFERRHAGDIISRFGSILPIQNVLTSGLIDGAIGGLMALILLILMLVYNPWLALIAVVAVGLIAIARLSSFQAMKRRNDSSIVAQAKQDTYLLETVRGISTLRLFAAEIPRHAAWQAKMVDVTNARIGYGRLQAFYNASNEALVGLELVISGYVAVRLSLDGGFSVGMLFAYMAYKGQFISKANTLLDRWMDYRMLDLYLRRLGDIALSPADPALARPTAYERLTPLEGSLELRGISYRYGEGEPMVLRDLDFTVAPGEHVAIIGPSGGGKTTLMKIMVGLLRPDQGLILIDGEPVDQFGQREFRRQIAAVMQEDRLFAGSIADNVALFDPQPDMALLQHCAQLAGIHVEIQKMPMRYETLVGDMGSSLSGGQKQRVLLARALYRKPRMLFMDEGTSHLDPLNEASVNKAISELGITRIVIAHRHETIRHADRVLLLADGRIASQRVRAVKP